MFCRSAEKLGKDVAKTTAEVIVKPAVAGLKVGIGGITLIKDAMKFIKL